MADLIPTGSLAPGVGTGTAPLAPSLTYRIDFDRGRVSGMANELEAVRQAVTLALGIDRYAHLIYSWNYGAEIRRLIGRDAAYVAVEGERLIREALSQDDRISGVRDFEFTVGTGSMLIRFTVDSFYGSFAHEQEVTGNV